MKQDAWSAGMMKEMMTKPTMKPGDIKKPSMDGHEKGGMKEMMGYDMGPTTFSETFVKHVSDWVLLT